MPPDTVYVGRGSLFGNPFRVGVDCKTAEIAADLYRHYLETMLDGDNFLSSPATAAEKRSNLDALRGKNIACWCPLDQPCHADVLLEIANAPIDEDQCSKPGCKEFECGICTGHAPYSTPMDKEGS